MPCTVQHYDQVLSTLRDFHTTICLSLFRQIVTFDTIMNKGNLLTIICITYQNIPKTTSMNCQYLLLVDYLARGFSFVEIVSNICTCSDTWIYLIFAQALIPVFVICPSSAMSISCLPSSCCLPVMLL